MATAPSKGVQYNEDGSVKTCVFCRIVAGTEPGGAQLLFQNEHLVMFRPAKPCADKHFLVVPRRHIRSVKSLTADDAPLVRSLLQAGSTFLDSMAAVAARPAPSPERRFMFHKPPGNSIDHLHLHVFEGNFLRWVYKAVVYNPNANPCCETVFSTLALRKRCSAPQPEAAPGPSRVELVEQLQMIKIDVSVLYCFTVDFRV